MNTIDLLAENINTVSARSAVELRKMGSALKIAGAAKGRKADLVTAIMDLIEIARMAKAAEDVKAKAVKRSNKCTECGRPEDFRGSNLCKVDREYGEWENTHSDEGHENGEGDTEDCPVCHPELDPRIRRAGRSRAGMVIVAKGTEVHKSQTFKLAAEAAGWTVTISTQEYADGDETNTRHFADAHRGDEAIQLAWEGRAYDYDGSSAQLKGKSRKVRNLKEALRLI